MIKKQGRKLMLEMTTLSVKLTQREKAVERVDEKVVESIDIKKQNSKLKALWLRIDADFRDGKDTATFYYSTDGETWQRMGNDFRMRFDWQRFFMGSKFGIFCYSTKRTGGWTDIDYFEYTRL